MWTRTATLRRSPDRRRRRRRRLSSRNDAATASTAATDCNDSDRAINPGSVDPCGGGDQDCDGSLRREPRRDLLSRPRWRRLRD
ncbi:MAG: putative metal-binding motif-containing protein [Sandaracinus sp.]|nr:putative metal-binding motif-containing protein [Sandaracinus sp.]